MSASESTRRPRILLAKPGMDGHNRGIHVISKALQHAGCEVIYLGIRRSSQEIVTTAVQEDVDLIGLSMLSGAHLELTREISDALRAAGREDLPMVVGGIIPEDDHAELESLGVAAIFTPGTRLDEMSRTVWSLLRGHGDMSLATAGNNDGEHA